MYLRMYVLNVYVQNAKHVFNAYLYISSLVGVVILSKSFAFYIPFIPYEKLVAITGAICNDGSKCKSPAICRSYRQT